MYLESSFPRVKGDKAFFKTRTILASYDECVKFKYVMKGRDMGKLSIYTKTYNNKSTTLLWRIAGDNGPNYPHTSYGQFPVKSGEPYEVSKI
jgi:hypothetical protein